MLAIFSVEAAVIPNLGKTEVSHGRAPFIVSIQKYSHNGYEHHCGGSIINADWIMTAAHCITTTHEVKDFVIYAGCTNIALPERTCTKRKVLAFRKHNLYNGNTDPYDIALIKVNNKFSFSTTVATISLPQPGSLPSGQGTLYGWGSISDTNIPNFPVNLQQVELPIITMSTCENIYGKNRYVNIHHTNVCTGPLTGGKGICNSDSGGPFVQNVGGKPTLIGIASWGGNPCGKKDTPSVFTKVSDFIPWINEGMDQQKGITFV